MKRQYNMTTTKVNNPTVTDNKYNEEEESPEKVLKT
jgi:hypothetical protein